MGIERKDMRNTGKQEEKRSIVHKGEKNAFVNFLTGFVQCTVYEGNEIKISVLSIF